MTVVTELFGLALAPLYAAIAEVESEGGKTSQNVYQIDQLFVLDANFILKTKCLRTGATYRPFKPVAILDRRASESMMAIYWEYYGRNYERATGKKVTYQVLARIHNGGPMGWLVSTTMPYWRKVERRLKKEIEEVENDR